MEMETLMKKKNFSISLINPLVKRLSNIYGGQLEKRCELYVDDVRKPAFGCLSQKTTAKRSSMFFCLRVSTKQQKAKLGFIVQLNSIVKFISDIKQYNLIIFISTESGYLRSSKTIDAVLKIIAEYSVIAMAVDHMDRITHLPIEMKKMIKSLNKNNVGLISARQKFSTLSDSYKDAFDKLLISTAGSEARTRKNRMNDGLKENANRGGAKPGMPMYGFKKKGIDSAEMVVVGFIFKLHFADLRYPKIARRLNKLGIPTRKSSKWGKDMVGKIIRRKDKYQKYLNFKPKEIHVIYLKKKLDKIAIKYAKTFLQTS